MADLLKRTGLTIVPSVHVLTAWDREHFTGRDHHIECQALRQIVSVREEKVFGQIDELEEALVPQLGYFAGREAEPDGTVDLLEDRGSYGG